MSQIPKFSCPCPRHTALSQEPGGFCSDCGSRFPAIDGLPELIFPLSLSPSDREFQEKYNQTATSYDAGLDWLFESFQEDQDSVRRKMIAELNICPGQHILEVGAGTGQDSRYILDALKGSGSLHIQDISRAMLAVAKKRLESFSTPVFAHVGNAAYLPFADSSFDSVYHFGGLNAFGDKKRAISEMARVTKEGGRVVFGDESVPPWLRKTFFGQILMKVNPLYRYSAPLDLLPETVRNVSCRWLLGNAFYLISFSASQKPLPLKYDLPFPGKDETLRSRFYLGRKKT